MTGVRTIDALQTTLFRMTHDPEFCDALLAGRGAARASTGLSDRELAPLLSAPRSCFSADRGGRRLEQFLRNVSSEFRAGCALGGAVFLVAFSRSAQFHDALREGRALPLAFADYAETSARERGDSEFFAVAHLEAEMARVRREAQTRAVAGACDWVLSPWARVVSQARGTTERVARLRNDAPDPATDGSEPAASEAVLLLAEPAAPAPGALRALRSEILSEIVAAFLDEAARGQSESRWPSFAAEHGLDGDEVVAVARSFIDEGIFVRAGP